MVCVATVHTADAIQSDPSPRWWKGNIHTHTLWSDGNDFPDMVASWYREHGYNFLALSDHNILSAGERWMPLSEIERRGGEDALREYTNRFGERWVETRERDDGSIEVRLKPLNPVPALVEAAHDFIMMQGEEITDSFERKPIHINATNLRDLIPPEGGDSVADTIRNNLRAVERHAEETGRAILAHVNHPNFGWAITAEDMAEVLEERFFEVFNGHTGVHNAGDETRPGTERMWDIANTIRLAELKAPPLFALAVDDSHNYHGRSSVSIPGRGWIMVRARRLTPESIIHAMKAGDFYASTGVTLEEVRYDAASRRLTVNVDVEPGETYTIQFIGTMNDTAEPQQQSQQQEDIAIGRILKSVEGARATYQLTGDELYVRAVVISSAAPDHPTPENLQKKAWTQPVGWREE